MSELAGVERPASRRPQLIINRVAALLIDHHLRERGQDISMLPATVWRIRDAAETWLRSMSPSTHRGGISNGLRDLTQSDFRLDDDQPLRMPRLLASLREGEDGDLSITFFNIEMSSDLSFDDSGAELDPPLEAMLTVIHHIPDTIMLAATDRRLAEVLSHPALEGIDIRIASITRQAASPNTVIALHSAGDVSLPLP